MNGTKILYVGMDVDAEKIAMSVMEREGNEIVSERFIPNTKEAVRKYFRNLQKDGVEVQTCYEAGFCGFALARQLSALKIGCAVAAPGMLPRMPSDRVKTDRRDARVLARALRNGDIHEVYLPTKQDEAVRDYLRMYDAAKDDLKRAKQRVVHFLHRRGMRYTAGNNWTGRYRRWLKERKLEHAIEQETLQGYYARVTELEEHCYQMAARVEELAEEPRYREPVRQLNAFKGVKTLTALSFIVEIGDFRRFATAEEFMAFLGLVPSEHSSGNKRRQGGITKAGNSHLRKLLVQSGWHYRSYYPASKQLLLRREGLPVQLVAYANRAGRRLHRKFTRLLYAGKRPQVAVTAVARELSGFIWGTMTGNIS